MKTKVFIFFIAIAVFAVSCNNKNTKESDHDHELEIEHEGEEAKFQYTVYTNDFELFAEADPFLVGEVSNVLSHFTKLVDFKPLTNAKVTLKLQVNGKEVSKTNETSDRPGIYSFDVSPTETGTGNLIYEISTPEGSFQLVVPNITVFMTEEEGHEAAEESEISTTNTAVFTKEQSWKIDFKTELPVVEHFGQVLKTTALVKNSPDDALILTAKSNGVVRFLTKDIIVGNAVSEGASLFSISGNQLSVNNSSVLFAEAKNNFETAKIDFERKNELANEKIVSEKVLLEARNKYENARITYENLENNFNENGELVKSANNGFISEVFVENGKYIQQGQPLARIVQNKRLLLHAEIQPKYKQVLEDFSGAVISTMGSKKVVELSELNGELIYYGKSAGSENFLIPVNLKVDNSNDLIPGEFVELFLKTTSEEDKITIPNSALLEEQGYFFVFVQKTPELFEKREVITGATDGLRTEIVEGILADERIVSVGGMFIKLVQATGTLDAHSGHVH